MKQLLYNLIHPLRSPAAVAGYYMVFAALWIFFSSYLFAHTFKDPQLLARFELIKGLMFGVITGGPLYLVLRNWQERQEISVDQDIMVELPHY